MCSNLDWRCSDDGVQYRGTSKAGATARTKRSEGLSLSGISWSKASAHGRAGLAGEAIVDVDCALLVSVFGDLAQRQQASVIEQRRWCCAVSYKCLSRNFGFSVDVNVMVMLVSDSDMHAFVFLLPSVYTKFIFKFN